MKLFVRLRHNVDIPIRGTAVVLVFGDLRRPGNETARVLDSFTLRQPDGSFGEGNFRALLESIDADQIRRGAIGANG